MLGRDDVGEENESLGRGIRGVDKTRVYRLGGPFEVLEQLRKDFWHAGLVYESIEKITIRVTQTCHK